MYFYILVSVICVLSVFPSLAVILVCVLLMVCLLMPGFCFELPLTADSEHVDIFYYNVKHKCISTVCIINEIHYINTGCTRCSLVRKGSEKQSRPSGVACSSRPDIPLTTEPASSYVKAVHL